MEIRHDNIIYISHISRLGGVESFAYYMAQKYRHLDICILCKTIDINQKERLRQFCPVYEHHGEKLLFKTMIINYDTTILNYADEKERRRLYGCSRRLYTTLLHNNT